MISDDQFERLARQRIALRKCPVARYIPSELMTFCIGEQNDEHEDCSHITVTHNDHLSDKSIQEASVNAFEGAVFYHIANCDQHCSWNASCAIRAGLKAAKMAK